MGAAAESVYKPYEAQFGRPTTYKPEVGPRVFEMMSTGRSQNQCAVALGICEDTFYEWVKKYSDFAEHVARGKAASKAWFEDQMLGNLNNHKYNTGLFKFAMANRFGWSEKVEQKTTVDVTVTHNVEQLSNEVFSALPDALKGIGIDRTSRTAPKELIIKAETENDNDSG